MFLTLPSAINRLPIRINTPITAVARVGQLIPDCGREGTSEGTTAAIGLEVVTATRVVLVGVACATLVEVGTGVGVGVALGTAVLVGVAVAAIDHDGRNEVVFFQHLLGLFDVLRIVVGFFPSPVDDVHFRIAGGLDYGG